MKAYAKHLSVPDPSHTLDLQRVVSKIHFTTEKRLSGSISRMWELVLLWIE